MPPSPWVAGCESWSGGDQDFTKVSDLNSFLSWSVWNCQYSAIYNLQKTLFLLVQPIQCMCVYVWAQLCPTLCDSMDWSLLDSSVHAIFQARILEWVPFPSLRELPNPGTKPMPHALAGGFFIVEPPGQPYPGASRSQCINKWEKKPFSCAQEFQINYVDTQPYWRGNMSFQSQKDQELAFQLHLHTKVEWL